MEGHNDSDDDGYAQSSGNSYVTGYASPGALSGFIDEVYNSIASDIRRGVQVYGRTYAAYGKHFYGLPIDEQEQDRNDLQHAKFCLMYNGKPHLAPIVSEPQQILDLGTGSGIWAVDMADRFPSAEVLGFDIAAIQPLWIPPNCQFEILDVKTDWLQGKDSFDFIHGPEFIFSIRDWPTLISQAYEHLKPGGYLELAATVPLVGCDDGTCPVDSSFKELWELYFDIADAMATDGYAPTIWKQQFVSEEIKQLTSGDRHQGDFVVPKPRSLDLDIYSEYCDPFLALAVQIRNVYVSDYLFELTEKFCDRQARTYQFTVTTTHTDQDEDKLITRKPWFRSYTASKSEWHQGPNNDLPKEDVVDIVDVEDIQEAVHAVIDLCV